MTEQQRMSLSTLRRPAQWLLEALTGDRPGKKAVNPETMLGSAAAWYAISTIAGDIAKMPLEPHRRITANDAGITGSNVARDHWTWRLLREESNRYQTADIFKETIQAHALGWGNGRAFIHRERAAPELIPLRPDRSRSYLIGGEKWHVTAPTADDPNVFEEYVRRIEGAAITGNQDFVWPRDVIAIPDRDVLHVMGFGYSGVEGKSLAQHGRDSIGGELDAQAYVRNQITKGYTGRLMLEAPPGVFRNEEDAKQFLQNFRKQYNQQDDAETVGMLREGIKAEALQMSHVDAQFMEQRKFNRQEIMLWFGLQHIPGDDSATSYNSLEQKQLSYLASCLDRWLVKWEMQCSAKLRTEVEKRQSELFFKFNRATWLATDTKTTAEVLTGYVRGRVLTRNEARNKIDHNPVDGGDVFENPAIDKVGDADNSDNADNAASNADNNDNRPNNLGVAEAASLVITSRFKQLVKVEANQVLQAAARKNINLLNWLDKHYDQWCTKLESVADEVGIDPKVVRDKALARKQEVIDATDCQPEDLVKSVSAVTSRWEHRHDLC